MGSRKPFTQVPVRAPGQHRGELGLGRFAAAVGALVVLLEQQPVPALAHPREREAAVQLLALEPERDVAVRDGVLHRDRPAALDRDVLVGAGVPDDHRAGAVFALGDAALELEVVERVVLGLDGEPLVARVERRALRHGP